eukprot:GFUD01104303.1.p1 GENE.GFUD01104303.1~~GFUD01104303.1.p1  ORF type:complete len:154 (-),score=40.54 GFUD01104303.1:54-515(-)
MVSQEVLLVLSILVTSLLLFLTVYFMITLSDLESDFINSLDCSARLNRWTIPRLVFMVTHSLLLVAQYSWVMLLVSLPFTTWLVYSRLKVKQGDSGLYDPTEIHIRENLRGAIKESLGFMGYHMASFFISMWLLVSLMSMNTDNPGVSGEVPW